MTPKSEGYRRKIIKKETLKELEVKLARRNKNDRNPEQDLLRLQDQKSTVSDLVYNYLRKTAYTDSVRKQRNNACNRFRKRNARRRTIHPKRKYTNNNGLKSYICNALSIAVYSGYLIPTDRRGQFLRLSPCMTLRHTFDQE
ncbi:PREDICTED: uncharacterized protein LOC108577255 [Habropoda laboriosa]|uniref:uncharacterized protein LOC108577255 n=1 Tax=Habropoda laboriosa TaxID=597456 RepID=UPI00083E5F4C|nr:PREDICTED: uncharacterized protein LOC108577255 [Habropoda laboriosa]